MARDNPWDWRILLNGRIDELGYGRGTSDTSLPFAELRRRSAISQKAKSAHPTTFSSQIREGLSGGHADREHVPATRPPNIGSSRSLARRTTSQR